MVEPTKEITFEHRPSGYVLAYRTVVSRHLPIPNCGRLQVSSQTRKFGAGELLVDPQQSNPSLFVLVEGEAQVCVEHGSLGLEVELRRLYPGDFYGIDTVVSGNAPHATMKATLPGTGLAIAKSTIDGLLVSSCRPRPSILSGAGQ